MKFDGSQLKELEDALGDAFDDSNFTRMLTHGFGSKIASQFSGVGYGKRVFEVVGWAGSRDRHDQLVRAARRENPDNPKLRAFEKRLGAVRTEDLEELEKSLMTATLDLRAVRDVGRSFDDMLWSPLIEPEDVQTAFRRIVDCLASVPRQSDGSLPLYTFATELAALVGREAAVQEWVKSLSIGPSPRVRLSAGRANPQILERIVKQSRALQHVATLRKAIERAEYQVCRILTSSGLSSGMGTGFLVSRNVVLTCQHVVDGVSPANITLEFDFKVRVPGQAPASGPKYAVKAILEEGTSKKLDYAFLLIDGAPGDEDVDGKARGWVELAAPGHVILSGSDLIIIQHPKGGPMQIMFDEVLQMNADQTQVTYTTNTEPGSSGSPCFNADWQVVALHCSGAAQYNEGVPLATIRTQLKNETTKALGWA